MRWEHVTLLVVHSQVKQVVIGDGFESGPGDFRVGGRGRGGGVSGPRDGGCCGGRLLGIGRRCFG